MNALPKTAHNTVRFCDICICIHCCERIYEEKDPIYLILTYNMPAVRSAGMFKW